MLLKDDSVLKSARVKGRNIILDTKKDLCLLSLSSITIRVFPCWQSQVWLNSCDNVSWHYFRTILSLRHALHREDILFLQWNSPLNVVGCPKYFESMNLLVFSGYQWYIWMYSAPKEKMNFCITLYHYFYEIVAGIGSFENFQDTPKPFIKGL